MIKKFRVVYIGLFSIVSTVFIFRLIMILPVKVPNSIKSSISNLITIPDTLPAGESSALYILGGSAPSTWRHIKKAAMLFRKGKTNTVLIRNSKMLWDYDPKLNRNLTLNEVVIKYLNSGGVPTDQIEKIPIKEGFFGTLSEARDVATFCKEKSYTSIILVSSPGHMKRVGVCFGYYLKAHNISMYIAHSDDPFLFRELVLEFIKLQVYRLIIAGDRVISGCRG